MRRASGLLAVCAALGWVTPSSAVVGGRPVPAGQLPFVANISIGGSFGCSGTLIAPQWVMTAGHCGSATGAASQGLLPSPAGLPPGAYDVRLGSVYADGRGGEDHAVTEVRVDSDYLVTNGTGNDVTLLKLDSPSRIAPLQIAAVSERSIWRPGVLATVAGFGTTSQDPSATPPDQMQMAQVPIATDEYCAQAYPGGLSTATDDGSFDPKTMLCAGYPQGGTDTCQGDSGGPLLSPLPDGRFRLVAATSFGSGCAQPGKPGVYARLAEGPIRAFIASVVPSALAGDSAAGSSGSQPGTARRPSGGAPRPRHAAKSRRGQRRRGARKSRRRRGRHRRTGRL